MNEVLSFNFFLIGKMILFQEERSTKCIKYARRRRWGYIGPKILEWTDPKEVTKSARELEVV